MKKILTMLLVLALALCAACAQAVPAYELDPVRARPAEKLSFRSGPGTDYTELFSICGKVPVFVNRGTYSTAGHHNEYLHNRSSRNQFDAPSSTALIFFISNLGCLSYV